MPELPEVEVVRRQLAVVWEGRRIERVWATRPSYFFVTPPRTLVRRLRGRTARRLVRAGKYIVAEFDDESRLLCHLGMTGQITSRPIDPDAHVHLVLELSGRGRPVITFRDVRKFGKVEWIAPGKSSPRLDRLGPDALTLTSEQLWTGLRGRRIPIKTALLDQSVAAGIGNIYADEALFAAGIRPTRPSGRVRRREVDRLVTELRRILSTSVRRGGSTINDYLQPDGRLGSYQNWHRVYGKTGQPCCACRTPLVRKVLTARSTHFCPRCQK